MIRNEAIAIMAYIILLFIAIFFEVIGVTFLNLADGFTVFIPTMLAIFFYCISIAIYILITANREVGIVNAVFSGTGTALVTIIGILLFDESVSILKFIGVGLIIFGAIFINLKRNEEAA